MSKTEKKQYHSLGVIDITLIDDDSTYTFTANVVAGQVLSDKLRLIPLTGTLEAISELVEFVDEQPVDAPVSPQEQLVDLDVIAIEATVFNNAYNSCFGDSVPTLTCKQVTEIAKNAVRAFRELYEPSLDD